MIKFFRKIRQNLLSEGKTGKYLKYAVGEIILVVIGILIALQVNNWNESKKKHAQEIRYLKRLKTDLVKDTVYYNLKIRDANISIQSNSLAIRKAYQNQGTLNELDELMKLYDYSDSRLIINNDTYKEMTNSGTFNLLKNEELKISILELYRTSGENTKHIEDFNDFTQSLLANLNNSNAFLKYYPYPIIRNIFDDEKMFNDSDWEFINDPTSHKFRLLENTMLTYILRQEELLPYYIDLKWKSILIVEMIEKELEKP